MAKSSATVKQTSPEAATAEKSGSRSYVVRERGRQQPKVVSAVLVDSHSTGDDSNRLAVIDVARVFREFKAFKDRARQLKEKVAVADGQVRELQEEIKSLQGAISKLPDNDETREARSVLTALLKRKAAAFQQRRGDARARLIQEESSSYHEYYKLLHAEVRQYAKENNIQLVVRDTRLQSLVTHQDTAKVDPKDHQAVLRHINLTHPPACGRVGRGSGRGG